MKSASITEFTQGNQEGLVEWRNDNYADNQPYVLLGPGIGENRGYPCTLHGFEVSGLYIDLRLATDKYQFNVLGLQPWHFYEKGEYRDAMQWLLGNRKPSKVILVCLSLGGFGFLNNTSSEDIAFVLSKTDEAHIIVTGPPADHKSYNSNHIEAIAASGKRIYIYSSANDSKDGTSFLYSQTLHDQLKAAGADVTLTMYSPGFGHNGTALHVWKSPEWYRWTSSIAPVEQPTNPSPVVVEPDPIVIDPPVVVPPVKPPVVIPPNPREIVRFEYWGENVKLTVKYKDGTKKVLQAAKGDAYTNIGFNIDAPDKPNATRKNNKSIYLDVK